MRFKTVLKSFLISVVLYICANYLAWLHKEDFYLVFESIQKGNIILEDGRIIVEGILQLNVFIPCMFFAVGLFFLIKSIFTLVRPVQYLSEKADSVK